MRRRLRRSAPLALALLAAGCLPASAAGPKRVSVGDYQAAPSIPPNRAYSVGVFSVEREGGKRRIVPTDGYVGIYYPDANECDSFDLPLATAIVPISSKGRFKHRERTPVANGFVKVRWKGRWVKSGVVSGSVTIKYAGCTSTRKWTGGKVSSAG